MLKSVLVICLVCLGIGLHGQAILFVDGKELSQSQTTNQSATEIAQRRVNEFVREGYLFAGVDSVVMRNGLDQIYLHRGQREEIAINQIEIQGSDLQDTDFGGHKTPQQLLDICTSNGYPFAQLHWDNFSRDKKGLLSGNLTIDPGPFIINDTLVYLSEIKTKPDFIQQSVSLGIGDPYSEKVFQNIGQKINRVTFLELSGQPDISFSGGKATTYLNLKEKESSSFEGVVGILPNQRGNSNLLITGYLDLSLGNLFYSGKELQLNWQQFAVESKQLMVDYAHPYLFGSDILLGAGFKLFKQDTTFLTRNFKFDVGTFLFGSNVKFHGTYNRFVSDLISPDVERISNQTVADYATDLYSLGITKQTGLNSLRTYWSFNLDITFGRKSIKRNNSLPSSFYDSLLEISSVFKLSAQSRWQKVLFDKTALFIENNLGLLENKQLLNNELYRIGGFKTLRGFNENFFFAQQYFLNRLELRQYFEQNSFLFLFYDQLFFNTRDRWQEPFGIGLGLSLDTNNGLFSFAFALGNSQDIPFDVNNTKIHIGYISQF
ncbi:MAG: hypothetical protein ACFHWX_21250 [Bacteroidota bacterium]